MKINSEEILLNPDFKLVDYPYFISGNEETMINKIEEILINKFKTKGFVEKERIEKIENFNDSAGLFHTKKLIILSNIKNLDKLKIENVIKNGNILIVSSTSSSKDWFVKNLFLKEKNYRLILCYKLDQDLKIKILNYYLGLKNIKLEKDVYWYLIENLDDRYIFFYNEIKKIIITNNQPYSLYNIKKIINKKTSSDHEKIFFKTLLKNSDVVNLYNSSVSSLSDFYLLFQHFKFYFNLIINNDTEQDVIKNFPKYLFKHQESFISIYRKINNNKKNKLLNLIYKTEYLIRKNSSQFEAIGLRFLLNFKKIITAF